MALIELYEIKHHPMPGGPTAVESMQMALESTLWRLHKGLMEHARGLEHDQGVEPRTIGHDEAEPEYGGAAAVQGSRQHLMLTGLDDDGKRLLAHVEIVEIAREDDLRNALASAQRLEGATGIRAKAVVVCISAQQGLPELPVHIHAMKDHSTADASVRSGETGRPGRPGSGTLFLR